jgi:uncharacterized protein YqeY
MPTTSIQVRLRIALTEALRSRDSIAASALRSALGAVANAEAVPSAHTSRVAGSEHVAGAVAGLGAAEAPRRELTEQDVTAIVAAEISDRRSAAGDYERLGRSDQSARLRREADILAELFTVRD